MKIALLVGLLLATLPALAQMQPPPPAHFKGANAIIVTTTDSVDLAWHTILETLLGKGYTVATKDAVLHTFATAPKNLGATSQQLTITGFVRHGASGQAEISLSGRHNYVTAMVYTLATATAAQPVAWRGGAPGVDTTMFELVEAVAADYPRQSKPLNYIAR